MSGTPGIDAARLGRRLETFARIGATARGGVDRQALTDGDAEARALLAQLGAARGFRVEQDGAANLFLRRRGRDDALPPLLLGSHLDTQPTGGRFDGALGVLGALEVLESLEDAGLPTPRAVELVAWTNEEGSRFLPGAMGSQAFAAGALDPAWLAARDGAGTSLADALARTLQALPHVPRRPLGTPIAAYLELHIEQGPVLEREDVPVGVVTGIQGTRWLDVTLTGAAAHAGTTPLAYRRDPMAAAAAALSSLLGTVMARDEAARLTVGRIRAEPGSVNAIPERVAFTLDLRHPVLAELDAIERAARTAIEAAARDARCQAEMRTVFDMAPVAFPPAMADLVEAAAGEAGLAARRMISGAFHDALFLARRAPAAMIFVPCREGISHNEAEFVEPRFVEAGARALMAATLRWLAAPIERL
ncbi:hydantoinase/carbamoylase family amidase [Aurantimonas sp. Leaf443]|uniref:hydantoinase/carbamoylase family amidase n=1 Tax=Aurantimonas sp. Leaf443 TaxID=1736378 RepID=UPI0006FF331C|nr:hydantoinase/carbamoylase family amidase [Aurantimonas sp. Leaf443]KQT85419.1 Zn-dependent hydrolase [Aurantimonas sp. Leaf443]